MSEVSDLSAVVDDGVLSEPYTIERSTGVFQLGGWVTTAINVPGYGVVSVATDQDLLMLPEGDRITGSMVFHSLQRIFETQIDGGYGQTAYGQGNFGETDQHVSDIMIWNYQRYRVLKVYPYPNRNYWKAIAVRLAGV
jgi:hypothetical protein